MVPSKRRRISIVWIVPLFAAVVAIGIDIQRIMAYAKKVLSRIGARGVDAATRIVGFFVSMMGMGLIFHGLVEAIQAYATKGPES
ncbi:MAG TPA: MarC family protein [Candidatus Binatia bacterium]